jgi:hypothetical protein
MYPSTVEEEWAEVELEEE